LRIRKNCYYYLLGDILDVTVCGEDMTWTFGVKEINEHTNKINKLPIIVLGLKSN